MVPSFTRDDPALEADNQKRKKGLKDNLSGLLGLTIIGFTIFFVYLILKPTFSSENASKPLQKSAALVLVPVPACPLVNTKNSSSCRHTTCPDTYFNSDSNFVEKAPVPPKDCLEIQRALYCRHRTNDESDLKKSPGSRSKQFSRQVITPVKGGVEKQVLCDFETDGGGWTIIQQRQPGALMTQFYRNWKDYDQGFGIEFKSMSNSSRHLSGNSSYWLGLKAIRALTKDVEYTLRIELTDWEGETRMAQYRSFKVGSADDSYRLRICGYSGDAGDSLGYHNGQQFSTMDRDNDKAQNVHCAKTRHSGWWYNYCTESNLNGLYWDQYNKINENINKGDGITWYVWKGPNYSLKSVRMKIRPACFNANVND